jgi:hypothetical protein
MSEPLDIVGIDTDHVGHPRNDGSRGSGLYAVPIKLNRAPSPREAELLINHWDRPSQFTTMHRPGIARVSGSSLILTSTTIDEVSQYHAKTVRLAVDATNADEVQLRAADERREAEQRAQSDQHRTHTDDVARDIRF